MQGRVKDGQGRDRHWSLIIFPTVRCENDWDLAGVKGRKGQEEMTVANFDQSWNL